ncbi:hypothetical protein [Hymenobacter sp. B81]
MRAFRASFTSSGTSPMTHGCQPAAGIQRLQPEGLLQEGYAQGQQLQQ